MQASDLVKDYQMLSHLTMHWQAGTGISGWASDRSPGEFSISKGVETQGER